MNKTKNAYYICGVNSMGSTWYLSDKGSTSCTLWSGAPKELRAVYDNIQEARDKVKELDEAYIFASTRHHIELCG